MNSRLACAVARTASERDKSGTRTSQLDLLHACLKRHTGTQLHSCTYHRTPQSIPKFHKDVKTVLKENENSVRISRGGCKRLRTRDSSIPLLCSTLAS